MKNLCTILFFSFLLTIAASLQAQTVYFTEGFEDAAVWPTSAPGTPTQVTAASGVWTLYGCYRTTSTSGKPVGTADLRLPKPTTIPTGGTGAFNFIISPQLSNGVGTVSIVEGRASSTPVTIEKSTDNGTTWVLVGTIQTTASATPASITVNDSKANKIRFSNQTTGSGKDEDLDEISITQASGTAIDGSVSVPNNYSLDQNYPNPFNPTTVISFSLVKAGFTSLAVYNVLGQKVADLISKELTAGRHEVNFNASKLTSGIYLYRIDSGDFSAMKKMMLIK